MRKINTDVLVPTEVRYHNRPVFTGPTIDEFNDFRLTVFPYDIEVMGREKLKQYLMQTRSECDAEICLLIWYAKNEIHQSIERIFNQAKNERLINQDFDLFTRTGVMVHRSNGFEISGDCGS